MSCVVVTGFNDLTTGLLRNGYKTQHWRSYDFCNPCGSGPRLANTVNTVPAFFIHFLCIMAIML